MQTSRHYAHRKVHHTFRPYNKDTLWTIWLPKNWTYSLNLEQVPDLLWSLFPATVDYKFGSHPVGQPRRGFPLASYNEEMQDMPKTCFCDKLKLQTSQPDTLCASPFIAARGTLVLLYVFSSCRCDFHTLPMKPLFTNVTPYPKLISSIVPSTASTVGITMLLLILIIKIVFFILRRGRWLWEFGLLFRRMLLNLHTTTLDFRRWRRPPEYLIGWVYCGFRSYNKSKNNQKKKGYPTLRNKTDWG